MTSCSTSCQTVNDVRVMPSSCTDGCSHFSVSSPRSTSSATVDADCSAVQCSSCCRYHHRHHHHHHHHHHRHPQPHSHHHHGNHINHYQQPVSYRPVFLFFLFIIFAYLLCINCSKQVCTIMTKVVIKLLQGSVVTQTSSC